MYPPTYWDIYSIRVQSAIPCCIELIAGYLSQDKPTKLKQLFSKSPIKIQLV